MYKRQIYDLSTWVAGMKALPAPSNIPECFVKLGFTEMPTIDSLRRRWKQIAKTAHPDAGGDEQYFITMKTAYDDAEHTFKEATP